MGNQATNKENANAQGHKIVLSLRCRDIVLHYPYKMKALISDISLFPHGLQGLKLWDTDIILSRFVILQRQKFRNKSAFVFKGGVGIVGIALSKWGGCKKIDMCDTKTQVFGNMVKNCHRNQVNNVHCFEVNLGEFGKYTEKYDFALATDLFSQGFQPQVILNIWRKVLKVGGQSIMVLPDKKDQAKKLLQIVDRSQFKITNMVLTAQEYEASPLLNKLQGQSEFPQIGKKNFYVILLAKLKQKVFSGKKEQKEIKQSKQPYNQLKEQTKIQITEAQNLQHQTKEQVKNVEKDENQAQQTLNKTLTKQKIDQSLINNTEIISLKQQNEAINLSQNQVKSAQIRQNCKNQSEQKPQKPQKPIVAQEAKMQAIEIQQRQIEDLNEKQPGSQGL